MQPQHGGRPSACTAVRSQALLERTRARLPIGHGCEPRMVIAPTVIPASSMTSRATASSIDSPWSRHQPEMSSGIHSWDTGPGSLPLQSQRSKPDANLGPWDAQYDSGASGSRTTYRGGQHEADLLNEARQASHHARPHALAAAQQSAAAVLGLHHHDRLMHASKVCYDVHGMSGGGATNEGRRVCHV